MWNVIRATLYQLKSDIVIWATFAGITILSLLLGVEYMDGVGKGGKMVMEMGMGLVMFSGFCTVITVINIVAKDFTDKTANYEIMTGHTRAQVFFGRVMVAVPVGMVLTFVSMIFAPIVISLMTGWGEMLDLGQMIVRYGLVLACLFPAACMIAMVAIVIRNHSVAFLVMFIVNELQVFLGTVKDIYEDVIITVLTPVSRCVTLLLVQSQPEIDATTGVARFDMSIPLDEVVSVAGGSVVWGIALLLIGYLVFRKSDLN